MINMSKCKNCGNEWWMHGPSEENECLFALSEKPEKSGLEILPWIITYYMVWVLGFRYLAQYIFRRLNASDHLAGFTLFDWIFIPVALGSFILLLGYVAKEVLPRSQ